MGGSNAVEDDPSGCAEGIADDVAIRTIEARFLNWPPRYKLLEGLFLSLPALDLSNKKMITRGYGCRRLSQ